MSVQGMNHFTVLSDDLEVTKQFYCDLLGLEVGPRPNFQFPGWWLYAGDTPVRLSHDTAVRNHACFASCCSTSVAHHDAPIGRISSLKSYCG